MMKDATAPKTTPTKSDPTASGMGEFQCVAAAMQLPATYYYLPLYLTFYDLVPLPYNVLPLLLVQRLNLP